MSLKFEKEKKRRKVKEKVKKLNEKKENERMQPRRVQLFLKKENIIVDTFCLFFLCYFFKDFVKFKNKLRTIEPRFCEKIKNN